MTDDQRLRNLKQRILDTSKTIPITHGFFTGGVINIKTSELIPEGLIMVGHTADDARFHCIEDPMTEEQRHHWVNGEWDLKGSQELKELTDQ